jgi:hypothetical protein
MFLFKLWLANFIIVLCGGEQGPPVFPDYNIFFDIPQYRTSILSMGTDFCVETLDQLSYAYEEWLTYQEEERKWGNHLT